MLLPFMSNTLSASIAFADVTNHLLSSPFVEWCLSTPVQERIDIANELDSLCLANLGEHMRKVYVEFNPSERMQGCDVAVLREGRHVISYNISSSIDIIGDPAVPRERIQVITINNSFVFSSGECSVRHLSIESLRESAIICVGGSVLVENCVCVSSLGSAVIAKSKKSKLTLHSSVITKSFCGITVSDEAECVMTETIVSHCKSCGMLLKDNCKLTATNCSFTRCQVSAAKIITGARTFFDTCAFVENYQHGILLHSAGGPVCALWKNLFQHNRRAIFHSIYGHKVTYDHAILGRDNIFRMNVEDVVLAAGNVVAPLRTSIDIDLILGPFRR